jgi:Lar family restriction alleviation protein
MKVKLEANEIIRNCPLCGDSASLHSTGIGMDQGTIYWPKCDDCALTLPGSTSRADVLARWNRRALGSRGKEETA